MGFLASRTSTRQPTPCTMASLASRLSLGAKPSSGRLASNATKPSAALPVKGVKQAAQLKLKAQRSLASSYAFSHRGQTYTLMRSTRTPF